jgi:hypothetical protein
MLHLIRLPAARNDFNRRIEENSLKGWLAAPIYKSASREIGRLRPDAVQKSTKRKILYEVIVV